MVIVFLLIMMPISVHAKDFGVQGHTYPILEPDLLQTIQNRLQNVDLEKHNQILKQRAIQTAQRPKPVSGISKATANRTWTYDPSISVPYDLKDHKGQIFQKAGTSVNPLMMRSMMKTLIFIDGDDDEQVDWALQQPHKIILVSGSPFDLMEAHDKEFYFDQHGKLTSKFSIKHVPARISQEGFLLKIEEIVL